MATKLSLLEFTIASHWLDSSQFHHILIDNFVDSFENIQLVEIITINVNDFSTAKNFKVC